MKEDTEGSSSSPLSRQEEAAGQAFVYIVLSLIGADVIMLLPLFQVAASIERRPDPIIPPSISLLGLFYMLGLLFLAGSVFWLRFRVGSPLSLAAQEFRQQIFIGIALANANLYLGFFWVVRGGAFPLSLPFFVGPALVLLLFVLPIVSKRASLTKQRFR